MGEESTDAVYIGKYEDGKVVFDHDITDVYPDNMVKPLPTIRGIMKDDSITITGLLCRKGLRRLYKALGIPGYLRTEFLFPKKKKRGTARRKRRMKRYKQSFINFMNAKYGSGLIGTRVCDYVISKDEIPAFTGPFEGEEDSDGQGI